MNKLYPIIFVITALFFKVSWADSKVLGSDVGVPQLGSFATVLPKFVTQTVYPDGRGSPLGSGNAKLGGQIFNQKCISCHGQAGKGGSGGQLTGTILPKEVWVKFPRPQKNIGQYWPYATTVFDYIRRSMPYQAPGSLSNDEAYSLTAYLLAQQGLIKEDLELNADSLVKVTMPNRDGFIRSY